MEVFFLREFLFSNQGKRCNNISFQNGSWTRPLAKRRKEKKRKITIRTVATPSDFVQTTVSFGTFFFHFCVGENDVCSIRGIFPSSSEGGLLFLATGFNFWSSVILWRSGRRNSPFFKKNIQSFYLQTTL